MYKLKFVVEIDMFKYVMSIIYMDVPNGCRISHIYLVIHNFNIVGSTLPVHR